MWSSQFDEVARSRVSYRPTNDNVHFHKLLNHTVNQRAVFVGAACH